MKRSADHRTLGGSLRPRGPVQLAVSTTAAPDATVLTVSGELDILTAAKLTTRLDDIVRRGHGAVVIDLSQTEFIDSLGLHALLNVQRRLARRSRALHVICGEGPVLRAIRLARLTEALSVLPTRAAYELRRRNGSL